MQPSLMRLAIIWLRQKPRWKLRKPSEYQHLQNHLLRKSRAITSRITPTGVGARIAWHAGDQTLTTDDPVPMPSELSQDADMVTILAGRMYPSMSVLATVVDAKGLADERTISRLTTFIKESGVPKIVFKSDQENAISAMTEAAIRRAGRTGVPENSDTFESGLTMAVSEFSAVGESASNGRAERTVQAVEDLLRTLKSALESRLKVRLGNQLPVVRWMVEHVATILNRYSVNKDGATPYFSCHGKRPADRLVEFGERVFYYVPRKVRAKLDQKWRLGIFIGHSTNSNEAYVGTASGSVVKSRSIARVKVADRWNADAVMKIEGIPGDLIAAGGEDTGQPIESSSTPHLDGDADARAAADDGQMEGQPQRARGQDKDMRQAKITTRDLVRYGYTSGCRRCDDLIAQVPHPNRNHSNECRFNTYMSWQQASDPKYEAVRHLFEQGSAAPTAEDPLDTSNLEQPGAVTPRATDDRPEPSGRWDPASHRGKPVSYGPAAAPPESESPPPDMDGVDLFYPSDDELMMDGEQPFNLSDPSADQMLDYLIGAGSDPHAAKLYAFAIMGKYAPTTLVEVFGRGGISDQANGPRRALNIQGLAALDLRTLKPNGDPWDFNKRADRNEARELINQLQPTWVIGSPPCTAFSIWNRNMNYPKMDRDRVNELIAEGQKHLSFVASLYRKQLRAGRHFLHEHPASALSWSEKVISALAKLPGVHCVVADQCQYGLTTPSEEDRNVMLPAMKPTRFMTSSPQMAKMLQKRCPKIHQHQQLVGGRCANAAFYPLGLIKAILRGIRNTAIADGMSTAGSSEGATAIKAMQLSSDEVMAIMNSSNKPGQIPYANSVVAPQSSARLSTGGKIPIAYTSDHFKGQYLDEYTGEVLPEALIRAAIVEELNYFNERVWELTTKDEMHKYKDFIFVRSRWVNCNKGDSEDPDCRARLVACEVNKTGEKNDLFYASTPPLEAKKAMFSRYAQHTRAGAKPLRLSFVDVRKAYFNGTPKRDIFMSLPKEMGLPSHYVAKQVKCVYGTRDAGAIWEDCYRDSLEAMGFVSGVASPCCFSHKAKGISVVVHGDDFTALGSDEVLDWYEAELAKSFEIKIRGRLGEGCAGPQEIRILNRVVRITPDGLTYEADPRHAELLSESMGLTSANAVSTPGQKDPEPDYTAVKGDEGSATMQYGDADASDGATGITNAIFTVKNYAAVIDKIRSAVVMPNASVSSLNATDSIDHSDIAKGNCFDSVCHDVIVCREPTPNRCQQVQSIKSIQSQIPLQSNSLSTKSGNQFANPLSKVRARTSAVKALNFSPAIENFSVPAYSTIYGRHPSLVQATKEGMVTVGSNVDRYTGKTGEQMQTRSKRSPERIAQLELARKRRQLLLTYHWFADAALVTDDDVARALLTIPTTDEFQPEDSESLSATLSRLNAVRTQPIKKGHPAAKRQGAKAVKQLERAAGAEFVLSREEATLFRALSARANFLSQDRPDINFATKELCREFAVPNQKSYLRLKRLIRYLVGLPRLVFRYDFPAKGVAPADSIELFVDTDFAGCRETRRSTSGGVALVGDLISSIGQRPKPLSPSPVVRQSSTALEPESPWDWGFNPFAGIWGMITSYVFIPMPRPRLASRAGEAWARYVTWTQRTCGSKRLYVQDVSSCSRFSEQRTRQTSSPNMLRDLS